MEAPLSIQEARKLLEDYTSTDKEIEEIRGSLQLLVELSYDPWISERKKNKENSVDGSEVE